MKATHNISHAISSYLKYRLRAHSRGGFGIHSPFMFRFVTQIVEENFPYYIYAPVEKARASLRRDKGMVDITDHGSGKSGRRRICDIVSRSAKPSKDAQLLFRIAVDIKAKNILELGTCLGLTTMYLASARSDARVTTLEGCPELARIAQRNLRNAGISNTEVVVGNIDNTLPTVLSGYDTLDLVFFDANHRKEPTLCYFRQCIGLINNATVFIFDDIHQSREMEEAWAEIKSNPTVRVTLDLYRMGIVFFNKELKREDYIVRY